MKSWFFIGPIDTDFLIKSDVMITLCHLVAQNEPMNAVGESFRVNLTSAWRYLQISPENKPVVPCIITEEQEIYINSPVVNDTLNKIGLISYPLKTKIYLLNPIIYSSFIILLPKF